MSYLKSYINTTLRVLMRNKLSSAINILGLAVGFSACMLIALFVLDEFKYDRHFSNHDRLYRITSDFSKDGKSHTSARTPGLLAPMLGEKLPEIQSVTRVLVPDEGFLFLKDKAFKETIIFTDEAFLQVFGITLLHGDRSNCLVNRGSMLVSESMVEKLYGRDWKQKDILGDRLLIDDRVPMTLTGVFEDLPGQTHFHSSIFATVPQGEENWMDGDQVFTYVLLNDHANPDAFRYKVGTFDFNFKDQKDARYNVQRITDIHLAAELEEDLSTPGNIASLYALLLIATFLLFTSIVNFINLYTALTLKRFKEVGVRKVLGAQRRQLCHQFMIETSLIVVVGIFLSLTITFTVFPSFNGLTGKLLTEANIFEISNLLVVAGMAILVVVLAGTYPSIFLASARATETLKGNVDVNASQRFKNGLLIFQFAISGIMIMLTWIALQQIHFINNKPLGFDKDKIVVLRNPYMIGTLEKMKTFRDALKQMPGVEHVSISGYTPAQKRWEKFRMTFSVGDKSISVPANWMLADESFLKTMGITLLEGRDFLDNHSLETKSVIINEKAASLLNLRAGGKSPVGQEVSYEDSDGSVEKYQVIGVVQDFNFASLHNEIKPVVLRAGYHRFEMALRLMDANSSATIAQIESLWKKFVPHIPFEYDYMLDRFTNLHGPDHIVGKLFSIGGGLTIFIALLGLFSMVSQATIQRTKEIGIRKVLGASERNIVWLLSAHFLKGVLAAGIIAWPIGWMLANTWLNNFAFKTEMPWWIFIGTIGILLLMAVITVSFESIRAALASPVKNLRHE